MGYHVGGPPGGEVGAAPLLTPLSAPHGSRSRRACLVPLLSLGEPELFAQAQFAPGGLARRLQERFRALVGFAPCVIRGEWGLLPRPRPLTVVGE